MQESIQESLKVVLDIQELDMKMLRLMRVKKERARELEQIEELPPGSKITFATEDIAFPWELLYREYYSRHGRGIYDPNLFWGWRFQIESLLVGPEKFPQQRQQAGKLSVSMGVNEAIDRRHDCGRCEEHHRRHQGRDRQVKWTVHALDLRHLEESHAETRVIRQLDAVEGRDPDDPQQVRARLTLVFTPAPHDIPGTIVHLAVRARRSGHDHVPQIRG